MHFAQSRAFPQTMKSFTVLDGIEEKASVYMSVKTN